MKSRRQEIILDVISKTDIETQDQLLEELKKRGITAAQATISRDLRELNLVKEPTGYGSYRYTVGELETPGDGPSRLRTIFREGVTSFDLAQNIVVLKTMPGLAAAAGAAVDAMELPGLVGSLAGDDTALLVMRTDGDAAALCEELRRLLARE